MIDDVYICGKDATIDGVGGILGSARVYAGRLINYDHATDTYDAVNSVAGQMLFDKADIANLMSQQLPGGNGLSVFDAVIDHEVGHVLGVGTWWEYNELYDPDSGPGVYNSNTNAAREWNAIGCSGPLPVELEGGRGTANVHWDDECLSHELMTGFLSGGMLLSKVTIGTLEDIGYEVNYGAADPYTMADLGPGCAASCPEKRRQRQLRSLATTDQKELSEEGLSQIKDFARMQLGSDNNLVSRTSSTASGDGLLVTSDSIHVLFMENDEIHSVHLSWEDVQPEPVQLPELHPDSSSVNEKKGRRKAPSGSVRERRFRDERKRGRVSSGRTVAP